MKKKPLIIAGVIVLISILLVSCCGILASLGYLYYKSQQKDEDNGVITQVQLSDSLETFKSNEAFDNYIEQTAQSYEEEIGEEMAPYTSAFGDIGDTTAESEESITNIQESEVDEGDIVKVYKDYFVVLSRGRLFTIKIKDRNDNTLQPVVKVNAYPEGFTQGTWYDEMLIYKDRIVVIGYSYDLEATEIELFTINNKGEISHEAGFFIDSNDYYSSRNYASRLKDNKLILYMPYYLFTWTYENEEYKREYKLPQIRQWKRENELTSRKDILSKTDIYKPVQEALYPTLHTIVTCDLNKSEFSCSAKAILGPYSRSFYVSRNAIYVWVSEEYKWWLEDPSTDSKEEGPDSYVYMILLDDQSARALQADGTPIDQFSFKEDDNGYLNVVVREYSAGDAMWNPESTSGKVALLRTSLEKFADTPQAVSVDDYTPLPEPEGYTFQNRFVGEYLLYGTGSNWYSDETSKNKIYIKNYTNDEDAQHLDLTHGVSRIEVMGEGAVVVGTSGDDLKFSSIELESTSKIKDTYIIPDASQGELRSHGFFYKANPNGTGVLGLPIRGGQSYEHLFSQSAEIVFLSVNSDKEFYNLGSLKASNVEEEYDDCEVSCIDWYGNSRPIFYKDRILSLLGYELIEGEIKNSTLQEARRVNYLTALP